MTRHRDIAICSLSCRYPDASTPEALWSNVLEGRRSFRALPPDRLDLASYQDEGGGGHDSITPIRAGLISDWAFDRAGFRIPRSTYHATDLTHWLALEVAAQAIEAIGGADTLDRDRVAVVVANTLTGEFSRANSLRLRLPFLDALIAQACDGIELDGANALALRKEFGAILRDRLAEPNEESLAGGLANTIAGRIANFFDFGGGAYVIDAACASSLIAIADAASLLETEAADAVVVVAVDLSLDPFELVGFSRNGALTHDVMRVFDARSSGFWPGEGAAAAVLVRGGDAAKRGLPRVAHLRGWGISTDGAGGLTRPDRHGQLRALERAYAKADADPSDLMMVEAHGTGTAVGDPVEIRALAELVGARREPLPVGSIKANIGHTKAAAGFAGLIKAVYALNTGTLPPHVGCEIPHPVFDEVEHRVLPAQGPVSLEPRRNALAGVSAFGFGGINAHLVVEAAGRRSAPPALPARPRYQDAEVFLFDAPTRAELLSRLDAASARAPQLSMSEFVDLSAHCADRAGQDAFRLAIVASDPDQFRERSEMAREAVAAGRNDLNAERGVFTGDAGKAARIGFVFPGQAAPARLDGGIWARRFDFVRDIVAAVPALGIADPVDTRVAQPAIAAASLAAMQLLEACGVEAAAATGHSLGELTALAWARAVKREDLVGLAVLRAATMTKHGAPGGAMLLVRCPRATCLELMSGLDLVLACENAERENVASGRAEQIVALEERARRAGIGASRLAVSHAFHSPLMAPAAPRFGCALRGYSLRAPGRPVFSPTIGRQVGADDDLRKLLAKQFVAPVHFEAALSALVDATDLIVEVGPGTGLARRAEVNGSRCLSVDAFAESLVPLLNVLAAAYANGVDLHLAPLFSDRSPRPIDLSARPKFLSNPCGGGAGEAPIAPVEQALPPDDRPAPAPDNSRSEQALDHLSAVRRTVAEATGLPEDSLTPTLRLLDDLHLNSLAVGRIVATVCAQLGRTTPHALTDYAGASLEELADNLGELDRLADGGGDGRDTIAGVAPWVACFAPVAEIAEERPGGSPISWRVQEICGAAGFDLTDGSGSAGLTGTLLHLGDWRSPEALTDLWRATRAVVDAGVRNIGFLHSGAPLSAFARSLHQEGLFDSVTVVRSDDAPPEQVDRALSSVHPGYNEVILSSDGGRRTPKYVLAAPAKKPGRHRPLGRGDVILVTGGTRGIGAECALRLGERLGLKLALCARSDPEHPEVRQTLERADATGIAAIYRKADVGD
ncbi:MAG: type I polyketide synthase, partial [Kiloniellales bacterium]